MAEIFFKYKHIPRQWARRPERYQYNFRTCEAALSDKIDN